MFFILLILLETEFVVDLELDPSQLHGAINPSLMKNQTFLAGNESGVHFCSSTLFHDTLITSNGSNTLATNRIEFEFIDADVTLQLWWYKIIIFRNQKLCMLMILPLAMTMMKQYHQ